MILPKKLRYNIATFKITSERLEGYLFDMSGNVTIMEFNYFN